MSCGTSWRQHPSTISTPAQCVNLQHSARLQHQWQHSRTGTDALGRKALYTCEQLVGVALLVLACAQVSCISPRSCCLLLTFMPLMQPIPG
jgi:hypothetical protein